MRRISIANLKQRGDLAWRIARDAVLHAFDDNLLHWAAAIAFYSALSFAPLLFTGVSVASFFVDAQWIIERLTTILRHWVPEGGDDLKMFVDQAVEARGQVGIISFAAFLFSGSRVFAALSRAIQVVYDLEDRESIVRETVVQLVMLLTIGVVFILALMSDFVFRLIWDAVRFLPAGEGLAFRVVSGGVQLALLFVAFWLIYRFVPREQRDAGSSLAGAIAATALFVLVRPIFIFYLNSFSNQDVLYGSLASVVIVLIWVWIGAIITLLGAEIAITTRHHTGGADAEELVEEAKGS